MNPNPLNLDLRVDHQIPIELGMASSEEIYIYVNVARLRFR